MSAFVAVCSVVAALLGIVTWIIKRRNEATPQQREDDRERERLVILADVQAARAVGDDARAESLLRRLNGLSAQPGSSAAGDQPGRAGE